MQGLHWAWTQIGTWVAQGSAFVAEEGPPVATRGFHDAWVKLLDMTYQTIRQLPIIVLALLVFTCFSFLGKGVRRVVKRLTDRYRGRRGHNVGLVLGRLAQAGIIMIGVLVALVIAVPSINAGSVIGFLGVSSVAVGFAFRDILQNFLAGLLLLVTEPFRIGDQIIVNSFEGTVEEIQARATLIRTYDGRRIVIPNANLFTSPVIVNTAFRQRRLQHEIPIDRDSNIGEARRLMLDAIKQTKGILSDPEPDATVTSITEKSVILRARWWVAPSQLKNAMDSQDEVLERIQKSLRKDQLGMDRVSAPEEPHDATANGNGNGHH